MLRWNFGKDGINVGDRTGLEITEGIGINAREGGKSCGSTNY